MRRGDLLVQLDTSQESAQLAAAQAEQRLANVNLERLRWLREKGVVSQAELDRVVAEAEQATAKAAEIDATIDRKTHPGALRGNPRAPPGPPRAISQRR